MAVTGKFRRGTITSPAVANLKDVSIDQQDERDMRTGDTDMYCKQPVLKKQKCSLKATVMSGDLLALKAAIDYHDVTVVVEDVAVGASGETVTNRTFVMKMATCNIGANADNDGGEGSGSINIEAGALGAS